ncbi:hypothetical protein G7Y89_g9844 [Cudoniella acicularis]|uniref:RING-type domain-containing protein n=1 Tax=Cudoniella acicularis TaxID=354080 RepID=A0A8H4RDW6_9HELO|nr:hypothetical protein G7Y89_g9844 [Cudoniella acicularis]
MPPPTPRRSPRSIERFTHSLTIAPHDTHETAVLLAICFTSGWSADRIALRMQDIYDSELLSAERIWDFYQLWLGKRGTARENFNEDERELMKVLMDGPGVRLAVWGRSMSATIRPHSVAFQSKWSPKINDGVALCPGFTPLCRELSKDYLSNKDPTLTYHLPTPSEEPVFALFSLTMSTIMETNLARWAAKMLDVLPKDIRPIREREHVDLIMDHLKQFQKDYEQCFGKIEDTRGGALGEIRDNTVYIRSTGYGAKVLLGLLMADRLHVVDRYRRLQRETICFRYVDYQSLAEDSKNCVICQEQLGAISPEMIQEMPIELTICCGQIIGAACLKRWLEEQRPRGNCPICRHQFSQIFLEKFFEGDQEPMDMDEDDDESLSELVNHEVIDLVSPSPSPQQHIELGGEAQAQMASQGQLETQAAGHEVDGDGDEFMMEG